MSGRGGRAGARAAGRTASRSRAAPGEATSAPDAASDHEVGRGDDADRGRGTMLEPRPTPEGPVRADFADRSGQECSIQSSSIADEACLWLGVDADVDGNPSTRMHLTRRMAAELARLLDRFAATGRLDGLRESLN